MAEPPDDNAAPPIWLPPSKNVTVPVGAVPATVAVKVTGWPNVDGSWEDASDVDVALRGPGVQVAVTFTEPPNAAAMICDPSVVSPLAPVTVYGYVADAIGMGGIKVVPFPLTRLQVPPATLKVTTKAT